MGGIFISYRRGDTSPYAGRLSDTLTNRFGPDSIFRDIDGIAPGERFPKVIERAVGSCDAMLALIGRRWLTVKDESRKRRLDDPKDYVRQEISAALRRDDVLVIPVLIEGATMPDAADLPEDLAPLAERNAVRISDGGWKDEVVHLIRALEKVVKDTKPAPRASMRRLLRRRSRRPRRPTGRHRSPTSRHPGRAGRRPVSGNPDRHTLSSPPRRVGVAEAGARSPFPSPPASRCP
ncbi:MAG: toll/interleukin-1 receptor domain-containing protein [Acidimicrobiales bacterium]